MARILRSAALPLAIALSLQSGALVLCESVCLELFRVVAASAQAAPAACHGAGEQSGGAGRLSETPSGCVHDGASDAILTPRDGPAQTRAQAAILCASAPFDCADLNGLAGSSAAHAPPGTSPRTIHPLRI
jgi:hypothetical protein